MSIVIRPKESFVVQVKSSKGYWIDVSSWKNKEDANTRKSLEQSQNTKFNFRVVLVRYNENDERIEEEI